MRPGWNAARRNRHAGTRAHGHGNDNRMVIPEPGYWWKKFSWHIQNLDSYVTITRPIHGHTLRFLVQPPRHGWFYPCSIDDICTVLRHCDPRHLALVKLIVLRQSTRKQRMLAPLWGRAVWVFERDQYQGPAIVLEALDLAPMCWHRAGQALTPERERELERLRTDGHAIHRTRRGVEIHVTPTSLRNTVLHRTLLHELGHHVDHSAHTLDQWQSRDAPTKEDFAHRYAAELYQVLSLERIVPFAPIIDTASLLRDGLPPEWFCQTPADHAPPPADASQEAVR